MVCATFGFFDLLATIVYGASNFFKNRSLMKNLVPQKIDKKRLCRGPHPWMKVKTWTEKGPSETQMCRACGLVSGTETMASPEAIDRIEENQKIRDIDAKLYRDFLAKEDEDIKQFFAREIQGGLNFDKLAKIHAAGMTFGQRFTYYKASKVEDIEKELTKSDS